MPTSLHLHEKVGHGASCEVWRCTREGEVFALKWMRRAHGDRRAALRLQLRREAFALGLLRHPSLVGIVGTGERDGQPYLLLPFIDGSPLAAVLRGGPMDPPAVADIARHLADALRRIHGLGYVHRDIKPDNIMLTPSGRPVLMDLGLAVRPTAEVSPQAAGTVRYASPEQLGVVKRPVDGRSDLYSLGVVLYECLTGRPPFDGSSVAELAAAHANRIPDPIGDLAPHVPAGLAQAVERLVAKDPDDRFVSAGAFLESLTGSGLPAPHDEPVVSPGPTTPLETEAMREWVRDRLGWRPAPAALVDRLVTLSSGSRAAVGFYLEALVDRGWIRPVDDRWEVEADALAEVALPRDIAGLLEQRLEGLPARVLAVLQPAAVMGMNVHPGPLARVVGCPEGEVQRAVEVACTARVLERVDGGRGSRLVHRSVREALLGGLKATEAASLHARIAAVIEADPSASAEARERLVDHYERAGLDAHREAHLRAAASAGAAALDRHDNERALKLTTAALESAASLGSGPTVEAPLRRRAGIAGLRLGQLDLARGHLRRALSIRADAPDRVDDLILLADVEAREGADARAYPLLCEALVVLGAPLPAVGAERAAAQAADARVIASWGDEDPSSGKEPGPARDRRSRLSRVHGLLSFISHFLGEPDLMPTVVLRELVNARELGAGAEYARANAMAAFHRGLIGDQQAVRTFGRRALRFAADHADAETLAYCRVNVGVALDWCGEPGARRRALEWHDHILEHCTAWDMAKHYGHIIAMASLRGDSRQVVEMVDHLLGLSVLDGGSIRGLVSVLGKKRLACLELGRVAEARRARRQEWEFASRLPDSKPVWRYYWANEIGSAVRRGAPAEELGDALREFRALGDHEWHNQHAWIAVGYAALARLVREPAAAAELNEVIEVLTERWHPIALWTTHAKTFEAALRRQAGDWAEAEALLAAAESAATEAESEWGAFEVARERARLALAQGQQATSTEALARAAEIARERGWVRRLNEVEREMGMSSEAPWMRQRGDSSADSSAPSLDRFSEAILEVSLATGASADPDEQARSALLALIRVFGAERAYLFVADDTDGGGTLVFRGGRDAGGQVLSEPTGYSSTVVQRAYSSGQTVVVTGTDQGEILGSESAVIHDLRSILACPLRISGRTIGAVYLDSRLVKGLFGSADAHILEAIANHIAIGFESARSARLEAERREIAKDLELTGAVQAFFLPAKPDLACAGMRMSVSYRPAIQCGGDWWWRRERPDGFDLLVADVTGHGVAPAMVVASMASMAHVLATEHPGAELAAFLERLHDALSEVVSDRYYVSLTGLSCSVGQSVVVHGCGGPPPLALRSDGTLSELIAPGAPLLSGASLNAGIAQHDLSPGDRLVVYTDGLTESENARGRQLGARGLGRLLKKTSHHPTPDARQALENALDAYAAPGPSDDDRTFALVDL